MGRFHSLASVVGALCLVVPAAGQPAAVKDPAELFPAGVLFYAELSKPGELARDVAALTAGSVLDDLPAYMAKLRDKSAEEGSFFGNELVAMLAAFAGPEMWNESKRLQGAALAVTGIDKVGNPDFVGVVLAGDSNLPGVIMRAYLCSNPFVRSAGQVEGVNIYCEHPSPHIAAQVPQGGAPPPPPLPAGPCFAQLPGLVILGSSKDAVGGVVRRWKKKDTGPSLAAVREFQACSTLRERAGVFCYANPAEIADKVEASFKSAPARRESLEWALIRELVNPKALSSVSGSLSLAGGSVDLQLLAKLQPNQSSPLLDLFTDQKVSPVNLQPVPRDAAMVATLSLGTAEKNAASLLAAADAVAKALGQIGATPGEALREIEGKLGPAHGKRLLSKIAAITLVVPARQEIPKGGVAIPMLVITGVEATAASQLEEVLPAFLGVMIGESMDPVTETVQGLKIRSLPAGAFPWKTPIHYGRNGAVFVLGQDRMLVAASLRRELKDSLTSDPRFLSGLQSHGEAALLGCCRWSTLLADSAKPSTNPGRSVPKQEFLAPPHDQVVDLDRLLKPLREHARNVPPLFLSVTRTSAELRLNVRQPDLKGPATQLINTGFKAWRDWSHGIRGQFAPGGSERQEAIPIPDKD